VLPWEFSEKTFEAIRYKEWILEYKMGHVMNVPMMLTLKHWIMDILQTILSKNPLLRSASEIDQLVEITCHITFFKNLKAGYDPSENGDVHADL
jgi:hypothetical protein